jgi:nucleotide-binding universal stress UspA family protein
MYRNILVPLDGSSFSEHSLPYAVEAAAARHARLTLALVHVRHSPVTTDRTLREALDAWEAAHSQREAEYLRDLAQRLSRENGIDARATLLTGDIVPALEREVRDGATDLVVMTTHGRAGLERAWLGSVADSLLRHLSVPVLLIRPPEERAPRTGPVQYRHVVIGLDGSPRAERAIEPALALVQAQKARVTLLRVVAPPSAVTSPYLPHAARISHEEMQERQEQATAYLADMRERLGDRVNHIETLAILEYHAARAILGYAADHDVDLIALSTHGRGAVSRLLMGSVTDKVVRATTVPVLVC